MNNKEDKSLATLRPDLAKEWHPWRNGDLRPENVTCGSNKKVWWYLPYEDPRTEKHFDFEWEAVVANRVGGKGCPYLNGRLAWPGFNDLATTHPDIASQWHPTKNGDLKPIDVSAGSNKEVWWYLPYDDPETGKHFDFEWMERVYRRIKNNTFCPFMDGRKVWVGFNDLTTTHPDLIKEWHPTKNGNLKPTDVTAGSEKKVWWYLPYDDPKTGKHFDFEWEAVVYSRVEGNGCPYLSYPCKEILTGFNDLTTTHPQLAKEWHPTKNGNLKPTDVTAGSEKKVWWYLPYDDPKTGKHFDFEWEARISSRTNGVGCPYLFNKKVWTGYNDLATTHPDLATEWHPTKNGDLKPTDVTAGSGKRVWWYLPYDDPKTGRHFDFEWEAITASRARGRGCPYFNGKSVWKGYNDLATTHSHLVAEWHPTKNGDLKPTDVTSHSGLKVWWHLPYDDPKTGRHFDFEWEAVVDSRANGIRCPYLFESRFEKHIGEILTKNKIKYETQKTFKNCLSPKGNVLYYDLYLLNFGVLLEGDGEQHFRIVDYFGGKEDFEHRVKRDNIKNIYAFTNNKPLLRIPYIYVDDKDKIEMFIKYFLETGRIPQEIIDFYSQFEFSNYAEYAKNHNEKIKKTVTA